MNKRVQLSIIFPCYNEEESVATVLFEAQRLLQDNPQVEILVIDDGSTDGTLQKLEAFQPQIRVIAHRDNQGYGAALKTGLFYSHGDVVAFMDFDGTCSVHESLELLEALQREQADMVMGFRLHKASLMPPSRRLGNRLYRILLRTLYANKASLPRDVCTGFRVLKREVAEDLFDDLPNDLSFSPALTSKALKKNYFLVDHKISYSERKGTSKISLLRDGLKFGGVMIQRRLL